MEKHITLEELVISQIVPENKSTGREKDAFDVLKSAFTTVKPGSVLNVAITTQHFENLLITTGELKRDNS